MTITLDTLVESLDRNYNQNNAIVQFLPRFITDTGDVPMEVNGEARQIPTLNKLTSAINAATFMSRIDALEASGDETAAKVRGVISQLFGLTGKSSPFWKGFDVTAASTLADSSDPTNRVYFENGIRFPFEAYSVNQVDKKDGSSFAKIGNSLLPPFTETLLMGWGDGVPANNNPASLSSASNLNIAAYPAFSTTTYYTQTYWNYWAWYYGYYWYYWNLWYYTSSYTYAVTTTKSLQGSQTAQTFILPKDRIITAINVCAYGGSSYKNNKPAVLLCETSYGMPDLSKVITTGTVVEDSNYTSGSVTSYTSLSTSSMIRFNLTDPAYVKAGKSYAMVFIGNGAYYLWYGANNAANGGVFYTQDGAMWTQDLAKDILYALTCAEFTAGDNIVEIPALSVSGGIASIKTFLKGVTPPGTSIKLQAAVNASSWQDLGILDSLENLPPYTPIRAIFKCTTDVAPILDSLNSSITAFRPATDLKLVSKSLKTKAGGNTLSLSLALSGFDEALHTIGIKVKAAGSSTLIDPLWVKRNLDDKESGIIDVGFQLPGGVSEYVLVLTGHTATATRVFDINSILEV